MNICKLKMAQELTFADKVLLLRRQMRLNQTAFAKLVGVTRAWLSQIETGATPSEALRDRVERVENNWYVNAALDMAGAPPAPKPKSADSIGTRVKKGASARSAPQEGKASYEGARARLKAARIAAGYSTAAQFAKDVGYSLGVYDNIENGRSNISRKMAEKMAAKLSIPIEELIDGTEHVTEQTVPYGTMGETPDIEVPPGMKVKYVPLLAMAECGTSKAWTDDGYTHQGYVVFDPTDSKTYAVKLSGESMLPVFSPGDVAIVTPSKPLRNGCVVIARLDEDHGGDVMLKLYQGNADTVTLSSYNPVFPPITWPRSAFALIHYVSEVNKKLG